MAHEEFHAGDVVPTSGTYVQLNVVGTPTGTAIVLDAGETFPAAPRGFNWRSLSVRSSSEPRDRASYYRQMAGTASTAQIRDELLKLAQRFDELADQREERD